MIVVKLEMWPRGDEARKYELGRTYIYNDGGTVAQGNYEIRVCRKSKTYDLTVQEIRDGDKCTRKGSVENWPRQARNVWRLVLRCLMAAFPEEKSGRSEERNL